MMQGHSCLAEETNISTTKQAIKIKLAARVGHILNYSIYCHRSISCKTCTESDQTVPAFQAAFGGVKVVKELLVSRGKT